MPGTDEPGPIAIRLAAVEAAGRRLPQRESGTTLGGPHAEVEQAAIDVILCAQHIGTWILTGQGPS